MAEATDARRARSPARARGVKRQVALVHRGEAYLTSAARALRAELVEALGTRRPRVK
jgi:hypothetical protein